VTFCISLERQVVELSDRKETEIRMEMLNISKQMAITNSNRSITFFTKHTLTNTYEAPYDEHPV